jgi:hypothetical protein
MLKDCSMMKNIMTLGSLTQDKEPKEDPGGSDVMPVLGDDVVMTVYDGHHVSNLSLGTLTHCGWGPENTGV